MDQFRAKYQQRENAYNQVHTFQILDEEPAQLDDVEMEEQMPETNMSDEQFTIAREAMNIDQQEVLISMEYS